MVKDTNIVPLTSSGAIAEISRLFSSKDEQKTSELKFDKTLPQKSLEIKKSVVWKNKEGKLLK